MQVTHALSPHRPCSAAGAPESFLQQQGASQWVPLPPTPRTGAHSWAGWGARTPTPTLLNGCVCDSVCTASCPVTNDHKRGASDSRRCPSQVAEVQTQDAGGVGALGGSGRGESRPPFSWMSGCVASLQSLPVSPASSLRASSGLSLPPASYQDFCRWTQPRYTQDGLVVRPFI